VRRAGACLAQVAELRELHVRPDHGATCDGITVRTGRASAERY
jgi:hypothetical protein